MNRKKVIKILEQFGYLDNKGNFQNIDCSKRIYTSLGILKILDYIDELIRIENSNKEAIVWIENFISSGSTSCNLGDLQFLVDLLKGDNND